ncbi:MAG: trypsin-like peptidase domain-containing protein [Chloroflexi bacterium]|nr:trypsin-like peptidase domain-containing protein [Chloroflexota bacterium]
MEKFFRLSPVISFLLVLTLVLGSACIQLLPQAPAQSPQPSPPVQPVAQSPAAAPNVTPIQPGFIIPIDRQTEPLPTIADVVAIVKPSVVAINTEITMLDVFNRPFTQEGAGSGWIISEDGIIVTNNHVLEGARAITVTLDDGRTFAADPQPIATDVLTDLAVIRINASNLPAITMGDSQILRLGDWVVAIGNSLNLGVTPSEGIVRTLKATVPVSAGQTLYDLIGTTAAINPGNSGGPLVNMAGEVVGITSAKISAAGVEGMGYAISSFTAKPVIESLIQRGFVLRPYLGISMRTVDQFVVLSANLAVSRGALIVSVASGSPADRAGVRAGDVITRFNGKDVNNVDELLRALHTSGIGQDVTMTVWRGRTESSFTVTLAESPAPPR